MSLKDVLAAPGIKSVLFTLFMTSFGFGVILPILPFYALSMGAKPFDLGILTAVFAFMSLVFSPLMGKLGDRYGRKKVLLVSAAGFAASYLLFAFSDTLAMAFVARALQGVCAAGMFPTCISLLSDLTTEQQRGRVMGMVGMAFSLGFIIGPAFGGLASSLSVPTAFLLSAALAAANAVSVFFFIREPHEKPESRDIMGKELSLLEHLSSPIAFLFLASSIITFMIGGLDAVLALFTAEKMRFSSAHVGLVFTYIGLLIMTMQYLSGSLINKHGEFRLIQLGLVLSGAGFFLLSFASDWISLLLPLAVFVSGNAMVFPSVISLLTKKVTGRRGAVLGLNSSFQSLGQMVGPLFGGFLYGINHTYAFIGFALAIWAYFLVFSFIARKKLA
ncbi:MAG: MFS transporter [Candidatus Aenigmarchaeota archaeon]|nr:MFS transporter [Candidatus Aenigmarchaeota archaeon]